MPHGAVMNAEEKRQQKQLNNHLYLFTNIFLLLPTFAKSLDYEKVLFRFWSPMP